MATHVAADVIVIKRVTGRAVCQRSLRERGPQRGAEYGRQTTPALGVEQFAGDPGAG